MSIQQVTATAIADISLDQAWQKLSDLSQAHMYVPDLNDTKITTESKQGVGTSRIVYGKQGPLIETVIEWNEGSGFLLKLHTDNGDEVPPIFSQARFEYKISKESEQQTRLENTMYFEMKWGVIGKLLAKLIVPTVQKMHDQIVVGQKLYYETGEKANKQDVIEILKRG